MDINQKPTVPAVLRDAAEIVKEKDDAIFSTWYDSKGNRDREYTFKQMWSESGAIAYRLHHEWGVKKGERVVLCYSPGLHFFAVFFGCLRAGVIAALVYPPDPSNLKASLQKFTNVIKNCTPVLCLIDSKVSLLRTTSQYNPFSRSRNLWPSDIPFKTSDDAGTTGCTKSFDEQSIIESDIAFLQYTSGSTGDPKGVMITFSALHANIQLIHNGFYQAFGEDGGVPSQLRGFSWLPQYHDLGLIYASIAPFLGGWRMHCMSPITFLQRPLLWLELMSKHRCHWGVAPDFAYRLVTRRMRETLEKNLPIVQSISTLDLSCIHNFQNGTEPVRSDTRAEFEDMFKPYGLRENWFHAGYGLAENVVGVCWVHEYVTSQSNPNLVAIGSNRTFDKSLVMKIVNPETCVELKSDSSIGELWIGGPSIAAGYYGQSDLTRTTFQAELSGFQVRSQRFLRTGDLAFMEKGYLFICGRMKDLIISNGRNVYPQDIEHAAQEARPIEIRPGCVAAFSSNETSQDGLLEIVFELRNGKESEINDVVRDVREAVFRAVGLYAVRIVAIQEKTIPKTTSGKIRRRATRDALSNGDLKIISNVEFPKESDTSFTSDSPTNVEGGKNSDMSVENKFFTSKNNISESLLLALSLNRTERLLYITNLLLDTANCILGHESSITAAQPLMDAGFDSMKAGRLYSTLQDQFGDPFDIDIPQTVLFDYPTISEIASFLEGYCKLQDLTGQGVSDQAPPHNVSSEDVENIAIVSMACNFPGNSNTPESFWDMLVNRTDAVTEIPPTRWDVESTYCSKDGNEKGKFYARHGAFIDNAHMFDNSFFGISASEAQVMDPQQRVLLEVGFEALSQAGFDKSSLLGTRTGVFVGCCNNEWAHGTIAAAGGPFAAAGASASLLANRISYVLGLRGPSETVDTACSSSLVALHNAIRSLQANDCTAALVGSVNVMTSPKAFEAFCSMHMLAPDGRCKAFDSTADGYVRGEGCGAVVLKKLSDARSDGSQVLAVIRGAAIGHNGRSASLTAPSSSAQKEVMQLALNEARANPSQVCFLEAHGTGTALGDPIEIAAIKEVYRSREPSNPLLIGAVKTNIGHLEGAAGMAGLIKAILILKNGMVPPNLHLTSLNSRLDLKSFPVVFPDSMTPISCNNSALVAVSSFGFGGANAHVILGCGDEEKKSVTADVESKPQIAFLFTGQGSQYSGMGSHLYASYASFQASIDKCASILSSFNEYLPCSLPSLLFDNKYSELLAETRYCQPALFSLEYALVELLKEHGIVPNAIMGHSLGELSGACAAGVFSLEDGLKFTVARASAMSDVPPGDGCMYAVHCSESNIVQIMQEHGDKHGIKDVSIASINGPQSVTISGPESAVKLILSKLDGTASVRLDVSHAFHSTLISPAKAKVMAAAKLIKLYQGTTHLITNSTGKIALECDLTSPSHWAELVTSPVQFYSGMQTLASMGCTHFVEIGPCPVLSKMARRCLLDKKNITWVSMMQRIDNDPVRTFQDSVKTLKESLLSFSKRNTLNFRHTDIFKSQNPFPWYVPQGSGFQSSNIFEEIAVGNRTAKVFNEKITTGLISLFGECNVDNNPSMPAGWLISKAMDVYSKSCNDDLGFFLLEHVFFDNPASFGDSSMYVCTMLLPNCQGINDFRVSVGSTPNSSIQPVARGVISCICEPTLSIRVNLDDIRTRCSQPVNLDAFYERAQENGCRFHNRFRIMELASSGQNEILVILRNNCSNDQLATFSNRKGCFGAIMHSAFTSSSILLDKQRLFSIPLKVERISIVSKLISETIISHVRITKSSSMALSCDIDLIDSLTQCVFAEIRGLVMVDAMYFHDCCRFGSPLYELHWEQISIPEDISVLAQEDTQDWLVTGLEDNSDALSTFESVLEHEYPHVRLFSNSNYEDMTGWVLQRFNTSTKPPTLLLYYYDHESAIHDVSMSLIDIIRAAAELEINGNNVPLYVVTSGALQMESCTEYPDLNQSWVAGLLRSARLEYAKLEITHIDVDAPACSLENGGMKLAMKHIIDIVMQILKQKRDKNLLENNFCFRDSVLCVPRLCPQATDFDVSEPFKRLDENATYIITGGTGSLGLALANSMITEGNARNLVLISRSGTHHPDSEILWKTLNSFPGACVKVVKCDISELIDTRTKLVNVLSELPSVRGIIHAAGICPLSPVSKLDPDTVLETLKSKAGGAHVMNTLSTELQWDLDFFVAYSSFSSIVGDRTRAAYAAANSAMDGVMRYRRSLGLPALTIQWGPWSGAGMAGSLSLAAEELTGVRGCSFRLGILLLGQLLAMKFGETVVADINWHKYVKAFPGTDIILHELIQKENIHEADNINMRIPSSKNYGTSLESVLETILKHAKDVIGGDSTLSANVQLQDSGIDSLGAVQLHMLLKQSFGEDLVPTSLLLDYKTPSLMAKAIHKRMQNKSISKIEVNCTPILNNNLVFINPQNASKNGSCGTNCVENTVATWELPFIGNSPKTTLSSHQKSLPTNGHTSYVHESSDSSNAISNGNSKIPLDTVSNLNVTMNTEAPAEAHAAIQNNTPFGILTEAFLSMCAYVYMGFIIMLPGYLNISFASSLFPLNYATVLTIFVIAPIGWFAYITMLLGLIVLSKWILIGRISNGTFLKRGSFDYLRWWVVQRLMGFAKMLILEELLHTRLLAWYFRLLGAKVGRGVLFNTACISDPDMVTVGSGTVLNEQVVLQGSTITASGVKFNEILIGSGSVIMPNVVICAGGRVSNDVEVLPLTTVSSNHSGNFPSVTMKRSSKWSLWLSLKQSGIDLIGMYTVAISVGLGSYPAFLVLSKLLNMAQFQYLNPYIHESEDTILAERQVAFLCVVSIFILSRLYLPFVLAFAGMNTHKLYSVLSRVNTSSFKIGILLGIIAVSMITFYLSFIAVSILFKWVIVGRIRPARDPIRADSMRGIRKQIGDRIILAGMVRAVLLFNGHVGNSWWLWFLGAGIGTRVSIFLNKNIYTEPDLLDIGDDVHVGFASSTYCSVWVSPLHFELKVTTIGTRAMLGIGSVVMPGAVIPAGSALGPNTCAGPKDILQENVMYLGTPQPLPIRKYISPVRHLTRIERLLYVLVPIPMSLCTTFIMICGVYVPTYLIAFLARTRGNQHVTIMSPVLFLLFGTFLCIASSASKWCVLGRQIQSKHLMWSWYHYKTVVVFHVYVKSMMLFGDLLRGGKLYNLYLRSHGARVSPSALVHSIRVSDHDMLCIGDDAVISEDAVPHPLYYLEGKICIERVEICSDAVMHDRSILLGGGILERNETLGVLKVRARNSHKTL